MLNATNDVCTYSAVVHNAFYFFNYKVLSTWYSLLSVTSVVVLFDSCETVSLS